MFNLKEPEVYALGHIQTIGVGNERIWDDEIGFHPKAEVQEGDSIGWNVPRAVIQSFEIAPQSRKSKGCNNLCI
jgi:hypothetical protein